MRIAAILISVMLAAPAWAEEVLYCAETDSNGFYWEEGSSEGKRTGFKPKRYIVNIISESRRNISPMIGDTKGSTSRYTCRRYDPDIPRQVVCNSILGLTPWIFHDNTFVRAFLPGPPTAPPGKADNNVIISYGTCVKY